MADQAVSHKIPFMRYNIYSLLLICVVILIASCRKDKKMEFSSEYKRSHDAWLDFKSKSANKYQYTVNQSSVFNFGANTTITVVNGKITERKFSSYKSDGGTGQIVITSEWTEDANSIGSHTRGAAAVTMDEVYAKAKNEWLKKRENVKVYFESKNNGMLSTAGFVPDGCMDDCFEGIHVTSIIQY